jgi:hypothetical protein
VQYCEHSQEHSSLALASVCFLLLSPRAAGADPISVLLEFVVKDNTGVILGVVSQQNFPSGIIVLMRDTVNNANFFIQISTDRFRGSDDADVYFTSADCTGAGAAFVEAPSTRLRTGFDFAQETRLSTNGGGLAPASTRWQKFLLSFLLCSLVAKTRFLPLPEGEGT